MLGTTRLAAGLSLAFTTLGFASGHAQTVNPNLRVTNGSVQATACANNTICLGGFFTKVGPVTGGGVPVGINDGVPRAPYPRIEGTVQAVVSDGAGGWFIGGQLDRVGGLVRLNLAHVLSDGSVDSWSPDPDSAVLALDRNGTTPYAGGRFPHMGGAARNRIRAVDVTTGAATPWDPNSDHGGSSSIGGATRASVAEIGATSGLATEWNPGASGGVELVDLPGGDVRCEGYRDFQQPGGSCSRIRRASGPERGLGALGSPPFPGPRGRLRGPHRSAVHTPQIPVDVALRIESDLQRLQHPFEHALAPAGVGMRVGFPGSCPTVEAVESRESEAIEAVLLDQNVLAGVGNVFRSDVPFACRIHSFARVASLAAGERTLIYPTPSGAAIIRLMRSGFRMMACGGMILALACALLPPAAFATSRMGLIVPAYQYPTLGTLWADCAAASARVPLVAVMNPASGPGAGPDPTYVSAIAPVRTAGGRVIGYVPTFAAGIPLDSALAWVDRYRAWYALDGIFLDIMANDALPGHIAWYASLRDSIRARDPSWLVVGNPGTGTLEPYVAGADVICNHESYGEGYFGWEPDAWVTSYPPSRFLHLVHTLSTSDSMRAAVSRARTRHAGWVFVTHDTMPNPWDVTPVYWNELIAAVETTWVAASPLPPPRSPGLRVWPNPSRGTVYFTLAAETQPAAVDIHDLAGRRVLRLAAERGALTWNAREGGAPTPAGMYLARPVGSRAPPARFVILP